MTDLSPDTPTGEPIDAGDLAGAVARLLEAIDLPVEAPSRGAAIGNATVCLERFEGGRYLP